MKSSAVAVIRVSRKNIREQIAGSLLQIVQLLVDNPSSINVRYEVGENTTVFHIETEQKNIGSILGSRGKHIESLRTIVTAAAARNHIRAVISLPYYKKENP
jgi:predicted RNA-binding protein YlqC (UPF0109 family)